MAVEIRLPQWGMGMLEGTVVSWYVREGATVRAGEPIAEIEAAKTTEELTAPADGTIDRIVAEEGETVAVHELLAVLDSGEQTPTRDAVASPAQADAGTPPNEGPTGAPTGAAGGDGAGGAAPARRRQVAPRVRALAHREGVDLETLEGSGPDGRITESDVRRAAASEGAPHAEPALAAEASSAPTVARTIPLTGMRGTIAQRMRDSLAGTAQLTLTSTADVTDVLEWRAAHTADRRPSLTDLLIKAGAIALRAHPGLNAHIDDEGIHLANEVHVGIATAIAGGLVVPVVRHADRLALSAVSEERARLVGLVRDGTAAADDITGSTFTVTNLGGYPVDAFTPIINPPEVAILGVGRSVEVPHRTDDDGIGWRRELTLSLTIDHRAVDGAPGAEFLQTLVGTLADLSVLTDSE